MDNILLVVSARLHGIIRLHNYHSLQSTVLPPGRKQKCSLGLIELHIVTVHRIADQGVLGDGRSLCAGEDLICVLGVSLLVNYELRSQKDAITSSDVHKAGALKAIQMMQRLTTKYEVIQEAQLLL